MSAQDDQGTMYFGCEDVVTFDGEVWSKYSVPGSYAVRGLAFGTGGRLWVGSVNEIGYFRSALSKGLSSFHSLVNRLPEKAREFGDVWNVLATEGGCIFVTTNSVLTWDGVAFTVTQMEGGRHLSGVESGGEILISHKPTGLWAAQRQQAQAVPFGTRTEFNLSTLGTEDIERLAPGDHPGTGQCRGWQSHAVWQRQRGVYHEEHSSRAARGPQGASCTWEPFMAGSEYSTPRETWYGRSASKGPGLANRVLPLLLQGRAALGHVGGGPVQAVGRHRNNAF